MSSVVRRSHFDPPNAAGRIEKRGKSRLVVTPTPRLARAARRNQSASELLSRSRLAFAREEM
jgi:hypothetical protein